LHSTVTKGAIGTFTSSAGMGVSRAASLAFRLINGVRVGRTTAGGSTSDPLRVETGRSGKCLRRAAKPYD
jgi:hypothetical protein